MQQWVKAKRERRAIEALIAFAMSNPSEADISNLNRKLLEIEKERKLKEDEWLNAHGHDRY
jgi:hypothetical protein